MDENLKESVRIVSEQIGASEIIIRVIEHDLALCDDMATALEILLRYKLGNEKKLCCALHRLRLSLLAAKEICGDYGTTKLTVHEWHQEQEGWKIEAE